MTKMARIKYSKNDSILKEARLNLVSLLWGGLAVAGYLFTTYQVWVLAGSSVYWDGVYVLLGTALLTAIICFVFYYKVNAMYN
jgi:hypothetical protein